MRTTDCNQQFKVRVNCATFNQAQYITDALNGFAMQKTEFLYICTIMDDCSTDKERSVIKQYLQRYFDLNDKGIVKNEETDDYVMTFARHKTNHNCFFAVYFLKYNHYSINKGFRKDEYCIEFVEYIPYIAICEGDDYWTDTLKLQKQVDFLETHPEYGMVYTNYKKYFQENGQTTISNCIQASFEDEIIRNRVATLTTLIRNSLLEKYRQHIGNIPNERGWMMGDYPTWIFVMANSKAKLIPDVTAVYRVLKNSFSHYTSYNKSKDFLLSTYDISFFFADKYDVSNKIRKTIANNEINDLLALAKKHHTNLHFPLLIFMIKNNIFSLKRFVSAKLRSTILGRRIYNQLKHFI